MQLKLLSLKCHATRFFDALLESVSQHWHTSRCFHFHSCFFTRTSATRNWYHLRLEVSNQTWIEQIKQDVNFNHSLRLSGGHHSISATLWYPHPAFAFRLSKRSRDSPRGMQISGYPRFSQRISVALHNKRTQTQSPVPCPVQTVMPRRSLALADVQWLMHMPSGQERKGWLHTVTHPALEIESRITTIPRYDFTQNSSRELVNSRLALNPRGERGHTSKLGSEIIVINFHFRRRHVECSYRTGKASFPLPFPFAKSVWFWSFLWIQCKVVRWFSCCFRCHAVQ